MSSLNDPLVETVRSSPLTSAPTIPPPSRLISSVNATSSPELFLMVPRQTPTGSAFFLQVEKTAAKMIREKRPRKNPNLLGKGETLDVVMISASIVFLALKDRGEV